MNKHNQKILVVWVILALITVVALAHTLKPLPKQLVGTYSYSVHPPYSGPKRGGGYELKEGNHAYAVVTSTKTYFLYVKEDSNWLPLWSNNLDLLNYEPSVGETVEVTGKICEKQDMYGESYLAIEVDSLEPA